VQAPTALAYQLQLFQGHGPRRGEPEITSMKFSKIAGACLLVTMFADVAHADDDAGFYLGGGFGQASEEFLVFNGDGPSYRLFGGYSFNRFFAAEAGYLDNGEVGDTFNGVHESLEMQGFYASGLAKWPIGKHFAPFAKLGYIFHDDIRAVSIGTQVLSTASSSDSDFIFGGGLEFKLGDNFRLRAEYEKVDVPDFDFDIVSFSAAYQF